VQLEAFLGDPDLRAKTLDRVRSRWEAREVVPLLYLKWSSEMKFASLAGTIAQTQDPDEFVRKTGLPLSLALVCETLINAGITFEDDDSAPFGFRMVCDEAIWAFGPEWLSAVPLGGDVTDVVPRFLPIFLGLVLSPKLPLSRHIDPAVRAAANEIVALWGRELSGEIVPRAVWRQVRLQAQAAAEGWADPAGSSVAALVESLPWPSVGIATELPAICQTFLNSHLQVLAAKASSERDWLAWSDRLAAERELNALRSDARYTDLADPELLDHFPDLNRRMSAAESPGLATRMEQAKADARQQMTPFLRALMEGLLTFLREEPE
tara:strand:- start:2638 stop:3606 length:969 start_codon:yes stop_codon:yes gene_type:complete